MDTAYSKACFSNLCITPKSNYNYSKLLCIPLINHLKMNALKCRTLTNMNAAMKQGVMGFPH